MDGRTDEESQSPDSAAAERLPCLGAVVALLGRSQLYRRHPRWPRPAHHQPVKENKTK